jgi:hypothetical protein
MSRLWRNKFKNRLGNFDNSNLGLLFAGHRVMPMWHIESFGGAAAAWYNRRKSNVIPAGDLR